MGTSMPLMACKITKYKNKQHHNDCTDYRIITSFWSSTCHRMTSQHFSKIEKWFIAMYVDEKVALSHSKSEMINNTDVNLRPLGTWLDMFFQGRGWASMFGMGSSPSKDDADTQELQVWDGSSFVMWIACLFWKFNCCIAGISTIHYDHRWLSNILLYKCMAWKAIYRIYTPRLAECPAHRWGRPCARHNSQHRASSSRDNNDSYRQWSRYITDILSGQPCFLLGKSHCTKFLQKGVFWLNRMPSRVLLSMSAMAVLEHFMPGCRYAHTCAESCSGHTNTGCFTVR